MASDDKTKFDVPWATLLPLVAVLAGVVAQYKPLISTRPLTPAEKPIPVPAREDVDARLWQDPIAVAQKQKSALFADVSTGLVSRDKAKGHDISDLKSLVQESAVSAERIGSKLLLLGVMIDAGPYSEQGELRLRTRQAILEGLSESGFVPVDGEHIGYVTSPWPLPKNYVLNVADPLANNQLLLPWEECVSVSPTPAKTARVIVLWLPATNFSPDPLAKLGAVIDYLAPPGIRDKVAVTLLGPANSTGLQNMVREVRAEDWNSPPALKDVTILSARATAADATLLYDPSSPPASTAAPAPDRVDDLLKEKVEGLEFVRTIATDDIVLRELIAELKLRQVDVETPSETDEASAKRPHVILLSEWDTPFGRSLGITFFAKASHQPIDKIITRWISGSTASQKPQETQARPIRTYRYLRGIDGQVPGDLSRGAVQEQTQKSNSGPDTVAIEATEGLNQADYLRRLARVLKESDTYWRRDGGAGIGAIGLLGSDIYDKLMILRALRPAFPDALFFTNTYDAHFERRDDLGDTHNLIIASPFGGELPTNSRRGQRVPPFRDSNQTALYAATLVATDHLDKNLAAYFFEHPRIFEISRHGAWELSNPWEFNGEQYSRTHKTWFREWLYSTGVRWHLLIAAAALAGIVIWVSASNAHRTLPGGGTTPQRLARVFSSTPFWVICGTPIIVLCVAAYAQSGTAALEPFAFFSGISIWPTEMLRLVALMLAIHFMIKAGIDLRANEREVEKRFCLKPLPRTRFRWADIGLGLELWRLAPAERPAVDSEFTAQSAWYAYCRRNKFWPRFIRVAILLTLYLVFASFLFSVFPHAVPPARGDTAKQFDSWVLRASVLGLMILSFYVVDAIQLNSNLIRLFAREVTKWGHGVAEQCRRSPPLTEEELSAYHEIFFVADRTRVVARLIWYPLIVLTLLVVARWSVFDNWSWPASLLIIYGLNAAWALGSAVYLRRAAEQLRTAALDNLALLRLGAFTDEVRRKTFDELIVEIRSLKKGAFAPLSEQPFIRAVLLNSGSLGLLAVAQRVLDLL
jgi:hypothetical protein